MIYVVVLTIAVEGNIIAVTVEGRREDVERAKEDVERL